MANVAYDDSLAIQHTLFYVPVKIERAMRDASTDFLKDLPIKEYHIPFILMIGYFDGISQKEINERVPFDKSRISVIVNELIKLKYVEDSNSGRSSCLHLTEAGKSISSVAKMYFKIVSDKVYSVLDPEEKETLIAILTKIDKHLDEVDTKNISNE